jgi:methionyl-tRNA formyltransferase
VPLKLQYFSGGPHERVLSALLKAGHSLEKVFVNDVERWPKVGATVEFARAHGIPVEVIGKRADLDRIVPEITGKNCLSAGFNFLFPKTVLDASAVFLNVHGSLLPKYAGARTLGWVIENGEAESGVTVHVIDEGVDTGPIIHQRAFALSPFETTRSLALKLALIEPAVVLEALEKYERVGLSDACAQESVEAILPNRIPEHSRLNPAEPLAALINKIRAADPDHYPAYFELNGEKVCIRIWRPGKPENEADLV